MDEGLISRIVAEVVSRLRRLEDVAGVETSGPPVDVVTEEVVSNAVKRGTGEILVVSGVIITPLARDLLRDSSVRLVEAGKEKLDSSPAKRSGGIAVGADHRGFVLKEKIKADLESVGRHIVDCGVFSPQEASYADVAEKVGEELVKQELATGIILDAGGTASAIVANKVKGIRAVSCHDVTSAKYARAHVDANVLCLGVGVVGDTTAQEIVATWLTTPFEGGKYTERVRRIMGIERRQRGE